MKIIPFLFALALGAYALPAQADNYDSEASLSADELDSLRGGFLTAGGLVIDFGLTQETVVNNIVTSQLNVSTQAITNNALVNYNALVQAADQNATVLLSSAGLVTVIKNTVNDAVIQNTNVLNIAVGNTAVFRQNHTLGNLLGGQAALGIH